MTTFYVATSGSPTGDGSLAKPFDTVATALSVVGGSHTILVQPGSYAGPIVVAKKHAGTPTDPTVIQSVAKWGAISSGFSIEKGGKHVVLDGFQVIGAVGDGISALADRSTIRNCWVSSSRNNGIVCHGDGGVVERNVVEFNGTHPQFDHGIYASGNELFVQSNIVRHNAGWGIHLYPGVQLAVVANNVVHHQVARKGILVVNAEGSIGKNRIVNNTVLDTEAVQVWRANGDVIVNNILLSDSAALVIFFHHGAPVETLVDYNLCVPQSAINGPHGLTGNLQFVSPANYVYWLKRDSLAIRAGSIEYAPETDFWGRPRNGNVDLGAFMYEPFLETEEARKTWYYGWPYRYHSPPGSIPDFWRLAPWPHTPTS